MAKKSIKARVEALDKEVKELQDDAQRGGDEGTARLLREIRKSLDRARENGDFVRL